MIPQRKAAPANRKARRATGLVRSRAKTGGPKPPAGARLAEALARTIAANDPAVTRGDGLIMGEKAAMFHRPGAGKPVFAYAVAVGKSRVTLHAMPMYCEPKIHKAFKKRIAGGDFGKGCIRFRPDAAVDMGVVAEFIRACAGVEVG
jgi:hypothetical protein